jgi:hypothetical protein
MFTGCLNHGLRRLNDYTDWIQSQKNCDVLKRKSVKSINPYKSVIQTSKENEGTEFMIQLPVGLSLNIFEITSTINLPYNHLYY